MRVKVCVLIERWSVFNHYYFTSVKDLTFINMKVFVKDPAGQTTTHYVEDSILVADLK